MTADPATMPAGPELDALVNGIIRMPGGKLSQYLPTAIRALETWADSESGCRQYEIQRKSDPGGDFYHVQLFRSSKQSAGFMQRVAIGEGESLQLAISRAIAMAGAARHNDAAIG